MNLCVRGTDLYKVFEGWWNIWWSNSILVYNELNVDKIYGEVIAILLYDELVFYECINISTL